MLAAGDKLKGMTDYRKIRRLDTGKLQPKYTALIHADSKLALTNFLAAGDQAKSVVITHHAPSIRSVLRPHPRSARLYDGQHPDT